MRATIIYKPGVSTQPMVELEGVLQFSPPMDVRPHWVLKSEKESLYVNADSYLTVLVREDA